jgi:hypothetical protein
LRLAEGWVTLADDLVLRQSHESVAWREKAKLVEFGMEHRSSRLRLIALGAGFAVAFGASSLAAQIGTVRSQQKLVPSRPLDPIDRLGSSVAGLGDLDGDGVEDLAAGAKFEDGPPDNRGAVWIFFMNSDGTVKSERKIDGPAGLESGSGFGMSVAAVGDLDGDGITELAVGVQARDLQRLGLDPLPARRRQRGSATEDRRGRLVRLFPGGPGRPRRGRHRRLGGG